MGRMKEIYMEAMELGVDPQSFLEEIIDYHYQQYKDLRHEPTDQSQEQSCPSSYHDMETAALSSSVMEKQCSEVDEGSDIFGK